MTIDPDIRDQAYQFFIEEASELLDVIETGLLNLRPEITVHKVHEIMRAAHSIKGGAASVDLDIIKTIAHRLEDAFKALYSDTVVVDTELENLLLRAYDCLRHPLQQQISTGSFNQKQATEAFDLIFSELEARLGPAIDDADSFLPSAVDLGVDIIASIFEVDVAEVLEQLQAVLSHSDSYDCAAELQTQLEILAGFAELVDLSEFTSVIATAQTAASKHRHRPLPVLEQLLNNVRDARTTILAGHKDAISGPSEILLSLAEGEVSGSDNPTYGDASPLDALEEFSWLDPAELDRSFNDDSLPTNNALYGAINQVSTLEEIWSIDAEEFPSAERIDDLADIISTDLSALENVWGESDTVDSTLDVEVTDFESIVEEPLSASLDWPEQTSSLQEPAVDLASQEKRSNPESSELLEEDIPTNIESAVGFISDVYDSLPKLPFDENRVPVNSVPKKPKALPRWKSSSKLSAKVSLDRLDRFDRLVGELAINRNSLSLQNDNFQRTVRRLGQRFFSFRSIVKQLQSLSDQILVSPEQRLIKPAAAHPAFDSLEMDSYGEINLLLEGILEEVLQLAESIDDVTLFAGQSNHLLERQRRTLTQLRDELMWSRMVPLSHVLQRFPRVIRELSATYKKEVQLNLVGTDVLVDRVMLEKLYDPLLHLLRNAFDHGIETPERRQSVGKPTQGTIEIRAYRQGNYTVIDIEDDGQGLNFDEIAKRAVATQLLSLDQVKTVPKQQIQQLIFEPGFSPARQISELSGRGVGLDVVKESVQAFNGKLSLTTHQGKGTVFSLKVPLTLTLTKLVVGNIGTVAVAFVSESIEEILSPHPDQLKLSGGKQFLSWQKQLIPVYDLSKLLAYNCQVPAQLPQELRESQSRQKQKSIMLIIQQGQTRLALCLEHIVTEQELVIKPVGKAIATPDYINGCTVLADGSLIPVIDGAALVQFDAGPSMPVLRQSQQKTVKTLMIVDDSSALRRTLALTLAKAGYQVLQAKDGCDAVEQLQQGASPDLIICDVEMPRLNGFEFLSQRQANSSWAKIPTIMLTSRGNHKHQTLARHLGATDYFTKPYIEKDFIGAIAKRLEQSP